MKRETAWRIFAGEYNDTTLEQKEEGEYTPNHIITPLGASINRVYIAGVLTDVENISDSGDFVRAHLSDPTGVFTIYSGQYHPEITQQLQDLDVPTYIAIIGKARTYQPEEGGMYVSVRPEAIHTITNDQRDQWIIECARDTKQRLSILLEAQKMAEPNTTELITLGATNDLASGIVKSLAHYPTIDTQKYLSIIRESLQYINNSLDLPTTNTLPATPTTATTQQPSSAKPAAQPPQADTKKEEELEKQILSVIQQLEGEEGAEWDAIIDTCKKDYDEATIEETLTRLMDKGFIFGPVLGIIKTT